MARRLLRGIALIFAATFITCGRNHQSSLQSAYDDARLKFERGDLTEAQAEADNYLGDPQLRPEWAWKFRVLKAEILIWRGMAPEALGLLKPEPPDSTSINDTAIRRKLWLSAALPLSVDAKQSLDEAEQLALKQQPELQHGSC